MTAATSTDSVTGGADTRPHRRVRRRWILAVVTVAIVVSGVAVGVTDPFSSSRPASNVVTDNAYPTSLIAVRRGPLSSQVTGVGTLGYTAQPDGTPYSVVNRASGVYTALPHIGDVIAQGQVLYAVTDSPVVLLGGTTPASRRLGVGAVGPDVAQLNAVLTAMGYANGLRLDPSSPSFSGETAAALTRLQAQLGLPQTGTLDLGQAEFLPAPIRITQVSATLGGDAQAGAAIAQATSTQRQVEVNIPASEQSSLAVGDAVLITLPNYQDTTGVVTSVGTVASGSSSTPPTVPVDIALQHPADAGTLDQAPVRVQITTTGVADALIVPVTALLAQPGGGYAVEAVDPHGMHRLVSVGIGLFDDADGLVQITSKTLAAGQQVVVPTR